jgi:hypothetical protein
MSKVSVILPSRGDNYEVQPGVTVLARMVDDIFEKATGEFEVLVGYDGEPYQHLAPRPNLTEHYFPYQGLKPTVNALAALATGEYLYKSDAHCMVSPGFDEVLQRQMEPNWLVFPRFYVLDAENWKWQDDRFYDYFLLDCPLTDPKGYRFRAGGHWVERTQERLNVGPVDESMALHGSGWFLSRDYFLNKLGGMQSYGYGVSYMEPADLGLRTWLGPWGGQVMVNKECWYAHMHKGNQRPRGYGISMREVRRSYDWTANYWMTNAWKERAHDLSWLIEKFWPIPTWPDNWQELQAQHEKDHPWVDNAV